MVKIGVRTPSIKRSVKARTTGRITRTVKRSVNPVYGKKGMGLITNPERSVKNAIYHRTTVGVNPLSGLSTNKIKTSSQSSSRQPTSNQVDQSLMSNSAPLSETPRNQTLLEIRDLDTESHADNIAKLISDISNDIERDELYSDLKRNDIIDFHFGEKIYQFDFFTINIHSDTDVNRNNGTYELRMKARYNSEYLTIGTIPSEYNEKLDILLSDTSLDIVISVRTAGGNYKQTSENKNGSISVRNYKEPLKFILQIQDAGPRKRAEQAALATYEEAQKKQQEALNIQTSKTVGGCFAIAFVGLIIVIAIISSIFN